MAACNQPNEHNVHYPHSLQSLTMSSTAVLSIAPIHEFPHVADLDAHQDLSKPLDSQPTSLPDPSAKIAEYVRTVQFPGKAEFREILADRQRTNDLYQYILETRKTLDHLTKECEDARTQCISELPESWTVRISPYFEDAHQMAIQRFHAPQSSYFLPSHDEQILALVRQWNVFPESIFAFPHGRERILAWIKTTYELERAAVRNKILGLRMSTRKNRKLNGKKLSQELLRSTRLPVTLQSIQKAVLLRHLAKMSGAWDGIRAPDTTQRQQQFWLDYLQELHTLRAMARHKAEARLSKVLKEDQRNHGPY
ncbi:hypothetical protein K493DRAFT_391287 [Basidiobolus meristosporus CBS 931.73]|uniref:Uncharacterized protein n=1 Tax=Basidiobolus meristosporus CBS 931.73 TaxID=1314790 RepID=A0A1Y1YRF6_9FUNG|nr:hypothetical protein K493DRAFT_391287 [Basidiobolus meristosporus CBS 931.73]|eukprot:ORY00621.1 hypothetical protein K493DRAFT_391287 [Basidiobolus meristosporus CBS 931.73]